jgi:hypothetical protein
VNDIYSNSGVFSKFHDISVPPKIKKLCGEGVMGLIIYGDRDKAIRVVSLMTKHLLDKGTMMPSPQMASMHKVFEYQKKAYKDSDAEDLIRNRVMRPPWLALYYFDQVLARIFDAEIHNAFKYWFTSMITSRAMGKAATVLVAEDLFKGKKIFHFLPKEFRELCDGNFREVAAKDYV